MRRNIISDKYTKICAEFHTPKTADTFCRNFNPDEAIMVDAWPGKDVVGASQVSIKTIFTCYGDASDVKSSDADWEVDDINKVVHIVGELNRV